MGGGVVKDWGDGGEGGVLAVMVWAHTLTFGHTHTHTHDRTSGTFFKTLGLTRCHGLSQGSFKNKFSSLLYSHKLSYFTCLLADR